MRVGHRDKATDRRCFLFFSGRLRWELDCQLKSFDLKARRKIGKIARRNPESSLESGK